MQQLLGAFIECICLFLFCFLFFIFYSVFSVVCSFLFCYCWGRGVALLFINVTISLVLRNLLSYACGYSVHFMHVLSTSLCTYLPLFVCQFHFSHSVSYCAKLLCFYFTLCFVLVTYYCVCTLAGVCVCMWVHRWGWV